MTNISLLDFLNKYEKLLIKILDITNDYDEFYNLVYDYVSKEDWDILAYFINNITKCLKLTKINFEQHLTTIPEYYHYESALLFDSSNYSKQCYLNMLGAYLDALKLLSIVIPKSVTRIDSCAFYGCINLDEVILSEGLLHISDQAFAYCLLHTPILMPKSLTYMADSIFEDTDDLQAIVYKNSYAYKWFLTNAEDNIFKVI